MEIEKNKKNENKLIERIKSGRKTFENYKHNYNLRVQK